MLSLLGFRSMQGLLPMPIRAISLSRISEKRQRLFYNCFQESKYIYMHVSIYLHGYKNIINNVCYSNLCYG